MPEWICPRCKQRFVQRKARHSCATQSVAAIFAGRPKLHALFRRLRAVIEAMGRVDVIATKSQVSFRSRTRFAWVWLPQRWLREAPEGELVLTFDLDHRVRSPLVKQAVEVRPHRWTHHVPLRAGTTIDPKVVAWLRAAHRVAAAPPQATKTRDRAGHRLLARWAADCAEHVLPQFEEARPRDERPRRAIAAARAWARGELTVGQARRAALDAHAAARAVKNPRARAAARSAGHAAATAHVGTHARAAGTYALAAAEPQELAWQRRRLPKKYWPSMFAPRDSRRRQLLHLAASSTTSRR